YYLDYFRYLHILFPVLADIEHRNLLVVLYQRSQRKFELALDLFGFRIRYPQSDCDIIGDMITADRYRIIKNKPFALEYRNVGHAPPDIQQHGSYVTFIRRQTNLCRSNCFGNYPIQLYVSPFHAFYDILDRYDLSYKHVRIDFETVPDHPYRVGYLVISVDDELPRDDVYKLHVFRYLDVPDVAEYFIQVVPGYFPSVYAQPAFVVHDIYVHTMDVDIS